MIVHIVNPFENAYGGSERAALALHEGLRGRCDVRLWSESVPDPRLGDLPIRHIDAAAGEYPSGGTLVMVGNYFLIGSWLEHSKAERRILNCNTIVPPRVKNYAIERLRASGGPVEIVYVSRLVRDWLGIPGEVHVSRIDLAEFAPFPRRDDGRFVVGRLSRDTPEKHHPDDAALYRRLAARQVRVRLMGGTCLAGVLGDDPGIELLAAGAEPASSFLQNLDCFLYRTSTKWIEVAGRVVSEAMACGLPGVCHRVGGYLDWIEHGKDGFVFESSSEAEAIVLALQRNPELRRQIGEAARAKMCAIFSAEANERYFDYFLSPPARSNTRPRERREIVFAWELGGNTGHVTTLHPIALAMKERGHAVRFLQRDPAAGTDLERAAEIPREGAPIWVGPVHYPNPLNFGEILHNFGYQDPAALRQLVDAWRERLANARAVVANVAPAAHIAARTLGIPSFEISQGFHIPPATMPAPPLRDWESAPRARLEAADRRVLDAVNRVLAAHRAPPIASIGELFLGRSMLLTYPELDIYPERGPADYYGIPESAEGTVIPDWPRAAGPRVLAYLYGYYAQLAPLTDALAQSGASVLLFARGAAPEIKARHRGGPVYFAEEPLCVSRLLPQCDLVLCHASHQMTAQALLAGKPLLLAPTQLEQFIIMRRVVRQGGGLGIAPDAPHADIGAAIRELARNPCYGEKAREFAARYRNHERGAALQTMIRRVEAALAE